MQKIVSVFQRNYDTDRLIRNEVVPGAEWVLAGEGVATRKYDGVGCMIDDGAGVFYRRHEVKKGKPAPPGWTAAQDPDPVTGDCPGWVPAGAGPEDKWFREAFAHLSASKLPQGCGTYEAVGPHFQGNPERFEDDTLIRHGEDVLDDCPRDFDAIREYLRPLDIEGIVFHHQDGRMAKVKKRDYGMKRVAIGG